ncbi:putative mitochondrial protein [Andalucia godoyi]|uniref:Putative mitochondrial protein n=1 Tax=Andalucia godoyi TaxID=505711 RepID=A0A8K0AG61_ANDGO|nr:putative mitochondrial protein [Andalucia godoyi]|eukprot:ANDGO_08032.mRNA.1 putative mitochondrial protein
MLRRVFIASRRFSTDAESATKSYAVEKAAFESAMKPLREQFRRESQQLSSDISTAKRTRTLQVQKLRNASSANANSLFLMQKAMDKKLFEMAEKTRIEQKPIIAQRKLQFKEKMIRDRQDRQALQLATLQKQSESWIAPDRVNEAIDEALAKEVTYDIGFDFSKRKTA